MTRTKRVSLRLILPLGFLFGLRGVAASHSGIVDGYGCHRGPDKVSYHCHQGQFAGRTFKSKEDFLRELRGGGVALRDCRGDRFVLLDRGRELVEQDRVVEHDSRLADDGGFFRFPFGVFDVDGDRFEGVGAVFFVKRLDVPQEVVAARTPRGPDIRESEIRRSTEGLRRGRARNRGDGERSPNGR